MAFKYSRLLSGGNRFSLQFLLLVLTVLVIGYSSRLSAEPPQQGLRPDPALVKGELDNGVEYLLLPNNKPKKRISLRLLVEAGSLNEKEDERGLAHFLEHISFCGTENFAPGTLIEYFQELGMAFGSDTNAYTSFDRTVYMIELPSPEIEKIDKALLVLRDYASRMLIKEEEVDRERGVILAEKRDRDSIDYRTTKAELSFLLPESIIPQRFPIGTEEVIRKTDAALLRKFYETWYRPERISLIVVGEITPEEVKPLLEKHFNDFTAAAPETPKPDPGKVVGKDIQAHLHTEKEAARITVSLQTVKPYSPSPDTLEDRIDKVTRHLAMQILQYRLDTLANKQDAPFIEGTAASYELFNFLTNTSINLTAKEKKWKETLSVAEQELRRALEHGVMNHELERAKAEILRHYRESARQAETRESRQLAEQLVKGIIKNRVFTHPEDIYEQISPAIEGITTKDMENALQKAWDGVGKFIFISGDLELKVPEEEVIKNVFLASSQHEVEPPEDKELAAFGYQDFGQAGKIKKRWDHEELDLTQILFTNGVRLNCKATDFSKGNIEIKARLGQGRLNEPETRPGLGIMTELSFIDGGLQAHDREELRRIFSGKKVGWTMSADHDAFVFHGQTNQEDLKRQFQLLAAYLSEPGFRENSLKRARNQLPELYNRARRTPEGVMQYDVARFLAGGDYRFGLPEKEQMLSYEIQDIKKWMNDPLKNGYLEISVVGDFSEEELLSTFKNTLAALPKRREKKEQKPKLKQLSRPSAGTEKTFKIPSRLPKARSLLYWPIPDMYNIGRTRRLSVLSAVFRERMRVNIREETGEVYSQFAVSRPSDTFTDYGWFFALAGTGPQNVKKITKKIREIGAELHSEGVTEDEARRIIAPILNSVRDSRRDNRYWLNSVMASSQEHPERLKWARNMAQDYQNITSDDLTEMARRYLKPGKEITVFIIPEENRKTR